MLEHHLPQSASTAAAPGEPALATTPGSRASQGASQASPCANRRGLGACFPLQKLSLIRRSTRGNPRRNQQRRPGERRKKNSLFDTLTLSNQRTSRTTWTVIDATGRRTSVISDKRGIIQRFKLGIPIRDMRLMDASGALLAAAAAAGGAPAPAAGAAPLTPDAAVIVVRDNAILVRMEHVRAIITANVVLIPSPETLATGAAAGLPLSAEAAAADAAAARFVAALRDAIVEAAAEARAHAARYMNGSNSGGGLGAFHAAARQAGPTSPTQQQQQQQQQQQASSSSASASTSPSHSNAAGTAGTAGTAGGLPPPHPPPNHLPAPGSIADSENEHEVAPLPFELAVLEAALRETTTNQARMVAELEAVLSPALDTLTKTVSQPALERVRKLKTRHQRLLTRVQSVREELQRFLDDDEDMFRMCLTRKLELEEERERACSAAAAAAAAVESGADAGRGNSGFPHAGGPASAPRPPLTAAIAVAAPRPGGAASAAQVPQSLFVGTPGTGFAFTRRPSVAFARPAFSSISSLTSTGAFPQPLSAEQAAAAEAAAAAAAAEEEENSEALETVENLLESYFMTVDGAYDRLVALDEFVEDTEEYINIELDSARNRLIRLDIVITAGSFAVAIFSLVAGVLGENVDIPKRIVDAGFGLVNLVTTLFAVSAFVGVMAYIRCVD